MFHYSTLVCVHSFGRKDGGWAVLPPGAVLPHVHTCGRAHSRALSHKNKYTLNLFSVFSLADSVL